MARRVLMTFALAVLVACGSSGKSSLTRRRAEAAGKNCPLGGTAVQTGVDTNGDGTLEPDEVTSTQYVCTGAPMDEVSDFTATAYSSGTVSLAWTTPTSSELTGVAIRRGTNGFPASVTDGVSVYSGTGTSASDTGLTVGTTYYYRAFGVGSDGRTSAGVDATATPLAAGTLDVTFNRKGWVSDAEGSASALGFAIDSQNRAVVVGYVDGAAKDFDLAAWRFNPDGSLDTSFGTGGKLTLDRILGYAGADTATAVALDSNGRIVITGYAEGPADSDMFVLRLLPNGSLDSTFGTHGVVALHDLVGPFPEAATSLAIDSAGKIVIGGNAVPRGITEVVILRLNSNGTFDTSFNSTGKIIIPYLPQAYSPFLNCSQVLTDPSGKVLVLGYGTGPVSTLDMGLWRFNNNGTADKSFGTNGYVTSHGVNSGDTYGLGMTLDSAGHVLVAGEAGSSNDAAVVWRYNSNGTLDASFNNKGLVILNPAASLDFANGVRVDSGSHIWVAGASTRKTNDTDVAVWRLTNSGQADTTFGTNGTATYANPDGHAAFNSAQSILMDSLGRPYIPGNSTFTNGQEMVLFRVVP